MNINDMVAWFETRGFKVTVARTKTGHMFKISKYDYHAVSIYEDGFGGEVTQQQFLDRLLSTWNTGYRRRQETFEKKMILVGMELGSGAFVFMNSVITTLNCRSIDITYIDHDKLRFETPHTKVWFIIGVGPKPSLDGIRADAIFGNPYRELRMRAKPDAIIASRDGIGLVDYICQVEREASESRRAMEIGESLHAGFTLGMNRAYEKRVTDTWISDMWPPALIMPEPPREEIKFIPNGTNLDGLRPGYYKIDEWDGYKTNLPPMSIKWPKTNPYIDHAFTMAGRRNGKSLYRHLINAVYGKSPTAQMELYAALMKGEIKMTEAEKKCVRNDRVDALAAAFRNIGNILNCKLPGIKNVHFSGPCTVVIWEDKTKTVVRCKDNDVVDYEKGLAMAIAKKALGTNKSGSNYYDIFKKWLPKEEENTEEVTK